MSGNYCLALSIPASHQIQADMGLSALMLTAPLWVASLNQWVALAGGIMAIALAGIRIFRILWRDKD